MAEIDEIRILRELAERGSMTPLELGRYLGVDPRTALETLRRMKKQGCVRGPFQGPGRPAHAATPVVSW